MTQLPSLNKASAWCLGISVGLIHPCILELFTGKPHNGLKPQKRLKQPKRKTTSRTSKNADLCKNKEPKHGKTSNRARTKKKSILIAGQKKITDYFQHNENNPITQNNETPPPVALFIDNADSTPSKESKSKEGIIKKIEVGETEKQNELRTKNSIAQTTPSAITRVPTRSTSKYAEFKRDLQSVKDFSIENMDWYDEDDNYHKNKAQAVLSDFAIPQKNRREGNVKLSYNYLLLDSRKCQNKENISWLDFIEAIFYIGKGKNKRAFKHAEEAEELLTKTSDKKKCLKIQEIWDSGNPIKVFFVTENVIAEEAFTREALMIDAMSLKKLCNKIRGSYYGVAATMKARECLELGATLLVEASEKFKIMHKIKTKDVYPKKNLNIATLDPSEDELERAVNAKEHVELGASSLLEGREIVEYDEAINGDLQQQLINIVTLD